jgi:hypothetical protein
MDFYTQTPTPPNTTCKILHFLLSSFLSFGVYLIAAIVWLMVNWYYALFALLLSYVLMGIVRSKLLHHSIPLSQQEFTYSDNDIAAWVLHRYLCPSEAQ